MLAPMSHRNLILVALLALTSWGTLACGRPRRADPVMPPARAGTASTGGSGVIIVEGTASYVEPAPASGAPASSATCTATLRVYDVRVRSGCVIDERVTAAPGTLVYPCGGGPASVSFGASTFTGSVSTNGDVALEIRTAFPFSDGCQWETKQFINGNLASGALHYEYREEPNPGQRGCAAACLGTASVTVGR